MSENPKTKKSTLDPACLCICPFFLLYPGLQSVTERDSGKFGVSAYSSGSPEINFSGRIHLYIEGDDALTVHLKEKLEENLRAAGMEVIIVDTIEEKYDSQALLVNISRNNWLYTPVYASSNLNLVFFLYVHR